MTLSIRLWGVALAVGLLVAFYGHSDTISAHHNPGGKLPGVPNTPTIQTLLRTGELTFCFDGRAAGYPEFRAQIRQVNAAITDAFGMRWLEIPGVFETADDAYLAGCQVFHEMPETHTCDGCAAHVFYSNKVCHIQYKWQLGFVYWLATAAHEIEHCLGAHEGYDDLRFLSHIITYKFWAPPWNEPHVMDFGTHLLAAYSPRGVWQMTGADVRVLCSWLDPDRNQFTGCGYVPPPPPPCASPCWDGDSWEFDPPYLGYLKSLVLNGGCGQWLDVQGRLAWGECASWGGRWNDLLKVWTRPQDTFEPTTGYWFAGGLVLP